MARIHARTKGKSGSVKPVNKDLSFVNMKKEEVEKLIINFAKDDVTSSKIGLILRDTYGVPCVKALTGKSVSKIIAENKLTSVVPEDLAALVAKSKALKKHLENNSRDTHNSRGLILIESKIRRLVKYYKGTNRIAENFKFN